MTKSAKSVRSAEPASTGSLRATAHPLRLRMLSLLTGTAMSASEVARELDVTQANASYHLRVLARAGLVVEAGEEQIRGGVAKRYRHPWDAEERNTVPPGDDPAGREQYLRTMGAELVRRGRLRKPKSHSFTADAEMWVSPEVRDQVAALVKEAAMLVHAEAQPPRTPGTVHVTLTTAFFELADPSLNDQDSRRVGKKVTGR